MSVRVKIPRNPKSKNQISQEELRNRTESVLREKGIHNNSQAIILESISKNIINSKNPLFETLKASPKVRDLDDAWAQSYEFVYDFLKKQGMNLTLSAMNTELGKTKPTLIYIFDTEDRDIFFDDLIENYKSIKDKSFKKHVNDFTLQESLYDE